MKATKSKKKVSFKSRKILKCHNCGYDGRTSFRKRFGGTAIYICKNCNADILRVDAKTGEKISMVKPTKFKVNIIGMWPPPKILNNLEEEE